MTQLSPRQQDILEMLRELAAAGKPAPTLQELCERLGLRSRGSMHKHIQALVDADLVIPQDGRHTGVLLSDKARQEIDYAPFFGQISAGSPVSAFEPQGKVQVPAMLRPDGDCYVLEVNGDSMTNAGLLDGDYVIVDRTRAPRNGDIVVAIVDGADLTLKTLVKQANKIVLQAENPAFTSQQYAPERVSIQGVVSAAMRKY